MGGDATRDALLTLDAEDNMADQDQTDWKAIAVQQQARLQQLEAAQDSATVSAALTAAIGSHPIVDHGHEQLVELLKPNVSVKDDGSGRRVAFGPGLQPVADLVKSKLAEPDFRKFIRSDHRGSSPTSDSPTRPADARPKNMGEAIIWDAEDARAATQAAGMNDPRVNLRLPMGVRPKS
jgi:hypothetical protein